jgi:hypothetical protein
VKYVKNNALRGRTFASLAEENQFLWDWETHVADTRIHGTTKQQVGKLFTQSESTALVRERINGWINSPSQPRHHRQIRGPIQIRAVSAQISAIPLLRTYYTLSSPKRSRRGCYGKFGSEPARNVVLDDTPRETTSHSRPEQRPHTCSKRHSDRTPKGDP